MLRSTPPGHLASVPAHRTQHTHREKVRVVSSPRVRSCREHAVMLTEDPPAPSEMSHAYPSPEDMPQCVSLLRPQVSPQSDRMSQPLCLLPPPHVWDTNPASCPLPGGLTLVSPTRCIAGIDYAQKPNPESGGHDEEP